MICSSRLSRGTKSIKMSFQHNFSNPIIKNTSIWTQFVNSSSVSSLSDIWFDSEDLFQNDFPSNIIPLSRCDFPPDLLPSPFMTLFVVAYLVIIVVALLGNLTVILVVAVDRKMRTVTNVLLVSLAVSDTLTAGLNMPFQLKFLIQNEWNVDEEALCKFTNYLQGVVVVTSIFTLTGIAIDRYYAICRPLKARHLHTIGRALVLIACFWVTAAVILIPQLKVQRLEPILIFDEQHASIRIVHMCVEYFSDHRLDIAYTSFFYVVLYALPVLVMIVAYSRIGVTLWYRSSSLVEASAGVRTDKRRRMVEKKRVVRMLIVIVAIFTISWFPFFTSQVYLLFDEGECHHQSSNRVIVAGLQLFAYSNCCINPIVYCLLNDSFKQSLRRAMAKVYIKRRLRRLTWSGRRGTLTDTVRTTAGLFSSSNRRGSYPNGPFARQPSVLQRNEPLEAKEHLKEIVAHWNVATAGGDGCHEDRCLGNESSSSEAVVLDRCQIRDAPPDEQFGNEADSMAAFNPWNLMDEVDSDQLMEIAFQSSDDHVKSFPLNHEINSSLESKNIIIPDDLSFAAAMFQPDCLLPSKNPDIPASICSEKSQKVPNGFSRSTGKYSIREDHKSDDDKHIDSTTVDNGDEKDHLMNDDDLQRRKEANYAEIQREFRNLELLLAQLLMDAGIQD